MFSLIRESFIILLLVLMSCTEKVSIEPEFTANTDCAGSNGRTQQLSQS